jgi:hypothetical protein
MTLGTLLRHAERHSHGRVTKLATVGGDCPILSSATSRRDEGKQAQSLACQFAARIGRLCDLANVTFQGHVENRSVAFAVVDKDFIAWRCFAKRSG